MDNRLHSVQYLRGLAAFLVVVAHSGAHPLASHSYVLDRLGQFGVTLFFVISGFIMVAISGPGKLAPFEFLKRRAIRIVPLYWIFTTLAAAMALVAPMLFRSTEFTWPHYVLSMLFIPHEAPGRGGTSPLLSLGWTLNYEVFFYLAFALCAAFAARRRVIALTLAFVALYVFGQLAGPLPTALGFYANQAILAFVAGAWLGLGHVQGRFTGASLRWSWIWVGLAAAGTVYAFFIDTAAEAGLVTFAALVLVSVGLVGAGLVAERVLPRLAPLEKLGDASYASYLVHMFVVGAVTGIANRLVGFENPVVYLGTVLCSIVLSTIAGILVHDWIERPLLKMMRGRSSRPAKKVDAAAAV